MCVADTLSRSYPQETKEELVSEAEISPKSYLPISPEMYVQFQKETAKDVKLTELSNMILKRLPDNRDHRDDIPQFLRQYRSYRDALLSRPFAV